MLELSSKACFQPNALRGTLASKPFKALLKAALADTPVPSLMRGHAQFGHILADDQCAPVHYTDTQYLGFARITVCNLSP